MKCSNCGNELNSSDNFCLKCGTKVENTTPVQQPVKNASKTSGVAIASLVIGIICILGSFVLNVIMIPVAIIGLILGICAKQKGALKIVPIILNIISVLIAGVVFALAALVFTGVKEGIKEIKEDLTGTYSDKHFSINYTVPWTEGTLSTGKKALKLMGFDSYFVFNGVSYYSDDLSCDVENITCQQQIGSSMYNVFKKSFEKQNMQVIGSYYPTFEKINNDTYYFTIEYGLSSIEKRGKVYVVVSEKENLILSFLSNGDKENLEELDIAVKALIKGIKLNNTEKPKPETTTKSSSSIISDALNSMSAWNRFESLRKGSLGTGKYLDGGWRVLSEATTYWVISGEKLYQYKEKDDNNNVIEATCSILSGKAGMSRIGIDSTKVDGIVERSKGLVTESDFYGLDCVADKYVKDGVEETSFKGKTQKIAFIIVDHGTEGIEAQTLNPQTASTNYFVKYED